MTDLTSRAEDTLNLVEQITEDEREWQMKVREFARARIAPVIAQDFEDAHFRRELVPELGELGVLGMHINGYGCAGAGPVAYGLVCHELEAVDSAWRTFVSVQGSLAMSAISKYGSEAQKQHWLPLMATGEAIGCFGLTEPGGGSDPASMETRAELKNDEWVLTGRKRWIGLASEAKVAVVWAQTEDGIRGFCVPTDTVGFRATPITGKMSMRASIQCDVDLDAVRLPESAVLPGAKGLSGPFGCLNEARYGIIWGAIGAGRDALDTAIAYAGQREVFGAPIGSRQLIQERLAEGYVRYARGILLALNLGRRKESGTLSATDISVGKLDNVREAMDIAASMRTVLGGEGITRDFSPMRHLANLESVRTYEGTDEVHKLVIGRALTGLAAFR